MAEPVSARWKDHALACEVGLEAVEEQRVIAVNHLDVVRRDIEALRLEEARTVARIDALVGVQRAFEKAVLGRAYKPDSPLAKSIAAKDGGR